MRKTLFILSLLYQCYTRAQSGSYIPFPSQMIIYGYTQSCSSGGLIDTDYRIEIGSDTIIQSRHYSKYYVDKAIEGGIRNDSIHKKVFLFNFKNQTEDLLFDFNLQEGDTIRYKNGVGFFPSLLPAPYVTIDTAWVTRIDSILMPHDGRYHKRFNLKAKVHFRDNPNKQTPLADSDKEVVLGDRTIKIQPFVEGVGPFYSPVDHYADFEECWYIRYYCISINGKTVVPNDPFGHPHDPKLCSVVYTGLGSSSITNHILIYPNPSGGKFTLVASNISNSHLEVMDIFGRCVMQTDIRKEETEINLIEFPKGIYFIRIFTDNALAGNKRIVIN